MTRALIGLGALTAIVVVLFPVHLHGSAYLEPERELLKEVAATYSFEKKNVRRIAISSSVADRWRATALGAWYTPWDVWSGSASASPEDAGAQLLLAKVGDTIGEGWRATSLVREKLQIHERAGH
jgi:hypothetical protein